MTRFDAMGFPALQEYCDSCGDEIESSIVAGSLCFDCRSGYEEDADA